MFEHEIPQSYCNRIRNFMQWAEDRIAKEIEQNDEIEARHGTTTFVSKPKTRTHTNLSLDQKRSIVEKIDSLRYAGDKVIPACEKVGIHHQTYLVWKKL